MITIFSTPRPFIGHHDIAQRNAIQSWLLLRPPCEIILINDEKNTTKKVAEEFGVKCLSDIKQNEYGTLLLNDVFSRVLKESKNDIIAHVNTDIILTKNFTEGINKINIRPFYMAGRRWDLDVHEPINFNDNLWEQKLKEKIKKNGTLHSRFGTDYWVFPREFKFDLPAFTVGRPAADTWLIYNARVSRVPVIDGTNFITIVHQNHPLLHYEDPIYLIEKKRNQRLYCGKKYKEEGGNFYCTIEDANYLLTKNGIEKKHFGWVMLQRKIRYAKDAPEILGGDRIFWKIIYYISQPFKFIYKFAKKIIRKILKIFKSIPSLNLKS